MNILAEYNLDIVELFENWEYYGVMFIVYGIGFRYVYFEYGGRDVEFWEGNYGVQFDDIEVLIDFNIFIFSQDIVMVFVWFLVFLNLIWGYIIVEFEIGIGEGYLLVFNFYGQFLRQVMVNGQGLVQLSLQELFWGIYFFYF